MPPGMVFFWLTSDHRGTLSRPEGHGQEPRWARLRGHPSALGIKVRPITLQGDERISGLLAGLGSSGGAAW